MGLYHNSGYNTYNTYIHNWLVVGPTPLKNMTSSVGSWDDDIPNGKKMFQATNQSTKWWQVRAKNDNFNDENL